jgi:hypothetical protein
MNMDPADFKISPDFIRYAKLTVCFFFSAYAMYEVFQAQSELDRKKVIWSSSPPPDRCVPFFEKRKLLDQYHQSQYLMDYRNGEALLRICTDAGRNITDPIFLNNYSTYVDPIAFSTGGECSLIQGREKALKACVAPEDDVDCVVAFKTKPLPNGIIWEYGISGLDMSDGSQSNVCGIQIRRVNSEACNKSFVHAYTESKPERTEIFHSAVACAVARLLTEIITIVIYQKKKDPAALFLADDGIIGPIYYFWIVCFSGEGFQGIPKLKEDYSFCGWVAFFFAQGIDAVNSIAMPVVALWGCEATQLSDKLALLAFGILKTTGMLAHKIYQRANSCAHPDSEAQPSSMEQAAA